MTTEYGKLYKLEFMPQGVFLILSEECFVDGVDEKGIVEHIKGRNLNAADITVVESMLRHRMTTAKVIAPPQPEPADGRVESQLSDDGDHVLIKVVPPMGKGKKATAEDVMKALSAVNAANFYLDHDRIESLLNTFKFSGFTEVGERRNGRVEITLAKDKTEAAIAIIPPFGGEPITVQDVFMYLGNEGITYGVKEEIIRKMVDSGIYNQSTVVAVGKKALDGENAVLEYYFDHTEHKPKPSIDDEGKVNFYELNIFKRVRNGDPLVRKTPATTGEAGMTIYGQEIPAKIGKDVPYPGGANTRPDKNDPNLIVAALDGQPKMISNKVSVIPVIEIHGNVDFSTGNIEFTGSVEIRGNVISGFTVKAMGDIRVGGCVEMARLEAGGNVTVRQGIVGQEKAIVIARGNVTAKYIDKATVYAEGNVIVDESIMYSRVSSASEVHLVGKKGYIIGGITRASKAVYSNQIGAQIQVPTTIEIGGSPSLREEMEQLEQEIDAFEEKADMQAKSLQSLEKRKASGDQATKDKIMQISRDRFALMSRLRAFKEKKEDLEEKLSRLRSHSLKVHVKQTLHPNTKLFIKNAAWVSRDPVEFSTFYERDGEVAFMPYEGGPKS